MSNDVAQQNLKEPEQVDWDNYNSGSKYQAPPPALGADGKPITYYGKVVEAAESQADNEYLNFQIDLKIVNSGSADGIKIRTWASAKPFEKNGEPVKGNPNKLANYLRSCGLQAKPQTNAEYRASVKSVASKVFPFTIDWEAKNGETGEKVKGFLNFPEDPDRPGQRKSILRKGDIYTERDFKGNITGTGTVQSEVLFANARLRYFQDATPKART